MKCIVLGNGIAGINVALVLSKLGVSVTYVYQFGEESLVKRLNGIKFGSEIHDEKCLVTMYLPDFIISSGWNRKLIPDVLKLVDCYNIHPSLLPEYRGINAIERQIKDHVHYSGLTLHKMDENYDTGPIYLQYKYRVNDCDTIKSLLVRNHIYIYRMLRQFIEEYPDLKCYKQDNWHNGY